MDNKYKSWGKNIPILDIFNSTEYELVPYIPYTITIDSKEYIIKIGNPWVLFRFMLIDIWIYKLLLGLKIINEQTYQFKERMLNANIQKIKKSDLMKKCFGLEYVGIHYDAIINKKKNTDKLFYPYVPNFLK